VPEDAFEVEGSKSAGDRCEHCNANPAGAVVRMEDPELKSTLCVTCDVRHRYHVSVTSKGYVISDDRRVHQYTLPERTCDDRARHDAPEWNDSASLCGHCSQLRNVAVPLPPFPLNTSETFRLTEQSHAALRRIMRQDWDEEKETTSQRCTNIF